ncbi:Type II secretion system protein G precursor [Planctomycetes bacterium MalM25]|nr:Type II secretion system protein G precursor [Planctomycetes bacterium MalM25]
MAPRPRQAGFTLIELITIALILGILSGVAIPRLYTGYDEAAIGATVSHLKTIALAAEMLQNETGDWPSDAATGDLPTELSGFLRPNLFAVACPTGGAYEWDTNVDSVAARVKIVRETNERSVWVRIDSLLDDGALTTGRMTAEITAGRDELRWVIDP